MKAITRPTPAEALILRKVEEQLEQDYDIKQACSRTALCLGLAPGRVATVYKELGRKRGDFSPERDGFRW